MKTHIITALKYLLIMTILTGVVYPLLMTGFAQLIFPKKANGSLITKDGKVIGSELIGQKFDTTMYFWSRPSSVNYNPIPSGASNYGPTSDTLLKLVTSRRELYSKLNSIAIADIPKEMVFASGSGLDPHISPGGALTQVDRVVRARDFTINQKETLISDIKAMSQMPQFQFLGEPRINVLDLNIRLDEIGKDHNFKLGDK